MTLTEKPASYYDRIYAESQKYREPFHKSIYFPIWSKLVEWLPDPSANILDVGCGTGQLCSFLRSSGYKFVTGIDFSEEAIRIARTLSTAVFKEEDIYSYPLYDAYDTLLITEVLEHLDKDVELLGRLKHKHIIFSVPSFDDPAHVRVFRSVEDVQQRYPFLNFTRAFSYKRWFLIESKLWI